MVKEGLRHDYDLRSNLHTKEEWVCLVCGEKLKGNTRWMDVFGEAVCMTCETPYQMLLAAGMSEDTELPYCKLNEKGLELAKAYWEETHKPMGLGTILIARDYPEDIAHYREFCQWAVKREQNPGGKND